VLKHLDINLLFLNLYFKIFGIMKRIIYSLAILICLGHSALVFGQPQKNDNNIVLKAEQGTVILAIQAKMLEAQSVDKILSNIDVEIVDKQTNESHVFTTDANGMIYFKAVCDRTYTLVGRSPDFYTTQIPVVTQCSISNDTLNVNLYIRPLSAEMYSVNITKVETTSTSKTHVVEKGDTLYSLSKKYKTTVAKLKELNKLESDKLDIGQTIRIN
jgi:LysM repeat protein